MKSSERLSRVRQLLAGLPGAYGNGHMRTLLEYADGVDLFAQAHAFVAQCAAGSGGDGPAARYPPRNGTELASAVREIDASDALAVFEGLTSRTLAYRTPGRYQAAKAAKVFRILARLLGPAARWYSNTDLSAWSPVTDSVMDALFIGAGGGVLVAILATDED